MIRRLTLVFVIGALTVLVSAGPALAAPAPQLGRTAVVNTVGGKVLVKDRGEGRFSELSRSARVVHMGALINATDGRVRLRTANGNGVFSLGAFSISQSRKPGSFAVLKMRGAGFGACRTGAQASRLLLRRLHGDAHGRFKTRGRYSAATVRGTKWEMEDRCDGTRTAARRGTVTTSDSGGDLVFDLDPGDVAQYFCDFDGQAPISGAFCTLVLNRPAQGLWAAGLVTLSEVPNYDLCLNDPSGEQRCGNFPFSQPDQYGLRQSVVVCTADRGPGEYTLRWFITGLQLGPPLGFEGTQPPMEFFCISEPPTA